MKRLGSRLVLSVSTALAVSLAACGHGSHSALPPAASGSNASSVYTGPLSDATFRITIPLPATSSKQRSPKYVSPSTSKVVFTLNTSSILSAAQVTSFNSTSLGTFAVTLSGSNPSGVTCTGSGPWTCTVAIKLPPGDDNLTISAQDSSSNVLSQQIQTFTVTAGGSGAAGGANAFSTTLDAKANTMAITTTSGQCAGSFTVNSTQGAATTGTSALTFYASYKDLAGNTFVNPAGKPILSVNGHTDDNFGSGYTITGSGGNVTVKVTQSTQSFTLQPTATGTTATINVAATPANTNGTSDGITFGSTTLSFPFASGSAPPASFLADAEQILDGNANTTGGKISLWTTNFTSFAPATPASLSAQPPPGPSGSDVDFPNDLVFDLNGDLLIANGGTGISGDVGNFACVPAGSITTSLNNATILTTNLDDPIQIAFSAPSPASINGDSSVALVNAGLPASGGDSSVEFLLNGTYAAAPSTRDVARVGNAVGLSVAAVEASGTNSAGSYAVSTYEGSSKTSKVQIIHPDGSATVLSDPDIALAFVAYDIAHHQLIIVSDGRSKNGCSTLCYQQSNIQVWNVNPVSKAYELKPITITDQPALDTFPLRKIAVSSDGHVAIAVSNDVSNPELNVYTNSGSALTQVGATLDYGASDCASAGGATPNYFYGGTGLNQNTISTLQFLGGTNHLLVGLESEQGAPPSLTRTAFNGMYIYDVTNVSQAQTGTRGCDGDTGDTLSTPTVSQTAFQVLSNRVLGAAYKP